MQQRQVENIIDSNSENKYINHQNPGIIQLYWAKYNTSIHPRSKKFEIVIIMDSDNDNVMHLVSAVITY